MPITLCRSLSVFHTHTHSEENLQHKRWRDIWWRLLSAKGRRARMCQTHKKSMANKSKCLQWKEAAKIKKTGWIWYADMTALWYKEDRNITERCTAQVLHLTSVQLTGSCWDTREHTFIQQPPRTLGCINHFVGRTRRRGLRSVTHLWWEKPFKPSLIWVPSACTKCAYIHK